MRTDSTPARSAAESHSQWGSKLGVFHFDLCIKDEIGRGSDMPLKFRLRGLAETFVDNISCPHCGHDGGEHGDNGFLTELTRVTFAGIIVVIQCENCSQVFIPEGQKLGIINSQRLRTAVEKDSDNTGQPALPDMKSVQLEVERLNAERGSKIH